MTLSNNVPSSKQFRSRIIEVLAHLLTAMRSLIAVLILSSNSAVL
jgi:hypothetical protein